MENLDINTLKKGGFMRQIQKGCFSVRLRTVAGEIKAEQLLKISEIAQEFGHGYIHLTARQGIEIPFIHQNDFAAVKRKLAEAGLEPGVCGPRVRTVTACQGDAICPSGLIDTTALAKELDARYFGLDLPHKLKFGVTGCAHNCLKAEENDVGIRGGFRPCWLEEPCSFCSLCEQVCPAKAIAVDKKRRRLSFREDACTYCGKCAKSCPTGAWQGNSGYLVFVGGLFGNRTAIGRQVLPIISDQDKLFQVIDSVIKFYEQTAKPGERLRATLERVGWDVLQEACQDDEVIAGDREQAVI
ncbi:anaerobic sulfite reductase subunit C [Peptococcaceae bacterium CEB3]|nr:anaerobic sulfite reductase subunit C [Peptococcaceae bacterium CEB3]